MSSKNTKTRHSFVAVYPSDWMAGTARMPRIVKSVFYDICMYIWDKAEPVPECELELMLADLAEGGHGFNIVDALVKSKKLIRLDDGSVYSERALDEAKRAFDLWQAKSQGGKNKRKIGSEPVKKTVEKEQESSEESSEVSCNTDPIEPEPEPEPDDSSNEESIPPLTGGVNSLREIDRPKTIAKPNPTVSLAEQSGKVLDAWNDMARTAGLSQVVKMTGKRPAHLKARLKDHGLEAIVDGIKTIPNFPFLMGKNPRKWKAHFDWLMQPSSCTKLIEGGYAEGAGEDSAWR